jgi:hypothetical protein
MQSNRTAVLGALVLALSINESPAIVGYVNEFFVPGNNLFANPLDAGTNTLSHLFANTPAGTTVSLWDPLSLSFTPASTFNDSAWSIDLTLNPGTGARLTVGTHYTNTFVGTVVGFVNDAPVIPPPFSGPDGVYLFASVPPLGLTGTDVFYNVLGRGPQHGEQFTWLDAATQLYHTTTYDASSQTWNNGTPVLAVGSAGFYSLGGASFIAAIPEPATTSLLLLASGLLALKQRRQR